jgi:hypothetical protein
MNMRVFYFAAFAMVALALGGPNAIAQTSQETISPSPKDYILLTIFLKHDESKPLAEINKELQQRNWMRDFPPPGVEVESWYVMMGIGQVVTLRVPPDKVREVNRMVEERAWGPYRTEFYLTYDYKAAAKASREKAQNDK